MSEPRYTLAEAKRIICQRRPGGHSIQQVVRQENGRGDVCVSEYGCVDCGMPFEERPPSAAAGWCAPKPGECWFRCNNGVHGHDYADFSLLHGCVMVCMNRDHCHR